MWYAYFRLNAIARVRRGSGDHISVRQYKASGPTPEFGADTMDADARGWLWRGGDLGIYVADQSEAEEGVKQIV